MAAIVPRMRVFGYPRDFLEKEVKNCYSGLKSLGVGVGGLPVPAL